MMLSVMVMGAGAAFTDQDKIVNEEAVDMISALGIVDGYEDDSFQPEKNIERGEAAKMIAVMLNGGKDAVQDTSVSSFNDVLGSADAWANKYIEYGVSKGILAGVGGDRFAPASNVTGTQLAKMLLVSLGYDADKEGYLDDTSWAVNVNADAASAGLYAGVESIDMSAALTRDNAAQMIWNALQAETVRYSLAGQAVKTGDTLLETAFGDGYGVDTGILTNIEWNKDRNEYTYTIDGEEYVTAGDYSDLFAMNVAVLRNGNDALFIRVDVGGVVVTGTMGDIEQVDANTISVDGQEYELDNLPAENRGFLSIIHGYNQYNNEIGWRYDQLQQYAFTAIDQDGGGDIEAIVVYPFAVLKTDNVLTNSFDINRINTQDAYLTVSANNDNFGDRAQDTNLMTLLGLSGNTATIRYNNVTVNGDIAIDGYVMAVPGEYTATGMDTYTVLSAQTGTVTKAANADRIVTIGNTEYDGNLLVGQTTFDSVNHLSVGSEYSYIEVNGYLFIVEGAGIVPAATNYVVATAVEESANKDGMYETDLLFSNGETKTVEARVLADGHVASLPLSNGNAAYVGSMYTYANDADGNYLLTRVADGTKANVTSVFDTQTVYKVGATLDEKNANHGVANEFDFNAKDAPTIDGTIVEDDAVIFAFIDRDQANYDVTGDLRSDEYVVLKGSDLKGLDETLINWAFTAETVKSQGVSTIDMAYIYMDTDLFDTTEYAYIDGHSMRYDGHYVSIDVKTADGDKTLTTASYLDQKVLKPLYDALENDVDGIVEVILDQAGNLVGFYDVDLDQDSAEVGAYNEATGAITIAGTNYLVDTAKTAIINVSGNTLQAKAIVDCVGTANEILDLLVIY